MANMYEVVGGTVIGRDHRLVTRNTQDSYHITEHAAGTIALVSDGCGSGEHSEVGAKVGVRLVAESILRELQARQSAQINWQRVKQDVLAALAVLARQMGGNFRQVVEEYFLFTIVGMYIAYDTATLFAIGDGVIVINGEILYRQPAEGNKPAYIGYGLLPGQIDVGESETDFQIVRSMPIGNLENFLIGTDGVKDLIGAQAKSQPGTQQQVGAISQFWTTDRYFRNDQLVSRQLKLIARDWPKQDPHPGLLPDDTTLIVGRRIPTTST